MKKITKITQKQIAAAGVQALANRPNVPAQYGKSGLSPQELKLHFDKLATLIAEKVNELGDVLSSDDAAQYIRIALDDYEVGSLAELIEAMQNGSFAEKILYVLPSVNSFKAVSLQQTIYGIAEAISENADEIMNVKDYVNTIVAPRLYPPRVIETHEPVQNCIEIYNDDRNGFLTTGYKFYLNGVFRTKYDGIGEPTVVSMTDIVNSGEEGVITVTSDGEGFGIKFQESFKSNGILFSNKLNFTINGIEYSAGINMSWRQWVESELSPEGYSISESGDITYYGNPIVFESTYTAVNASDTINAENYATAIVKTFSIARFGYISSNGDNTFNFFDGMNFAQWKQSRFNKFFIPDGDTVYEYQFKAIENEYTTIDVAATPNTPIEGIGFSNGTPVTDVDSIEANEYYLYDFDFYDPRNQLKEVMLEAGKSSKNVDLETVRKSFTLNGINGLTDSIESIAYNQDGTITINYETEADISVGVYFTGV